MAFGFGRYLNHAPSAHRDCNLRARMCRVVNPKDKTTFSVISFFAKRDIDEREELRYDYGVDEKELGFDYVPALVAGPTPSPSLSTSNSESDD